MIGLQGSEQVRYDQDHGYTVSETRKSTNSRCCSVLQGSICGFTIVTGGAARLVFGYDSYGNTCGQRNEQIEGVRLSGLDHTDRK